MGAKIRCDWASSHSNYFEYHDQDWGVPEEHDHMVFEKLCPELFQAGLSWRTILNKQENFRKVFKDFDAYCVSRFQSRKSLNCWTTEVSSGLGEKSRPLFTMASGSRN